VGKNGEPINYSILQEKMGSGAWKEISDCAGKIKMMITK